MRSTDIKDFLIFFGLALVLLAGALMWSEKSYYDHVAQMNDGVMVKVQQTNPKTIFAKADVWK